MRAIVGRRAFFQRVGVGFQPVEELSVAYQGHLHRFGDAGDLVARMQRAQEHEVVEHRERRRESAEQVLHAVGVDAVFHAYAGVVLPEHGCRHAHMADATMRGGGNETDHVQKGAAAHADHEFVAVNAHFHQPVLQAGDQRGVVFHLLATCHHFGTADQFKRIGVNLGIRGYVVDQRRPACRDVGIHEHREAMALGGFTAHHRLHKYRIVAGEHMLGEMHRVVVADREFLVVDRRRNRPMP